LLAACLAVGAGSLEAQASIVLPDKPLSPQLARIQDAAYVLRDSIYGATSAASRLRRDFRTTSAASLVSRAREMGRACEAVGRNIAAPRAAVHDGPGEGRFEAREQKRLLTALDELEGAAATCARDFGALAREGQGEQVRGYGNRHAETFIAGVRM